MNELISKKATIQALDDCIASAELSATRNILEVARKVVEDMPITEPWRDTAELPEHMRLLQFSPEKGIVHQGFYDKHSDEFFIQFTDFYYKGSEVRYWRYITAPDEEG